MHVHAVATDAGASQRRESISQLDIIAPRDGRRCQLARDGVKLSLLRSELRREREALSFAHGALGPGDGLFIRDALGEVRIVGRSSKTTERTSCSMTRP